jgi:hypothetical protein
VNKEPPTPTGYESDGTPHWCKPINAATDFYCLGVLFSCGHTYSCYHDPRAENHDREHRADRWSFGLFYIAVAVAVFVIILEWRGVI